MKNRSFIVASVLLVLAAFGVAAFYVTHPKEEDTAPSPWVFEALNRSDSYSVGPANAPVTIVEFFDPECESCRSMHPVVKQVMSEYAGKVRLIYRYMPYHPDSLYASSLLEEARAQGKFEQALDVFFEKQSEWGDHEKPRPDLLVGYLSSIGVDAKSVSKKEEVILKHRSIVDRDQADAFRLLVRGTPTFFVNGRMIFELGYDPLKAGVERALNEGRGEQ